MPKITLTITEAEYREAWIQARYKHVHGRYPEASIILESAFALWRKYEVKGPAREELEKLYREAHPGSKAVQPELAKAE